MGSSDIANENEGVSDRCILEIHSQVIWAPMQDQELWSVRGWNSGSLDSWEEGNLPSWQLVDSLAFG